MLYKFIDLLYQTVNLPCHIAIIPFGYRGIKVSKSLFLPDNVKIWAHGYKHLNRSLSLKRSEYPFGTNCSDVHRELFEIKDKLHNLFPDNFSPVFVPPWNHFDSSLKDCLKKTGYFFLSEIDAASFHYNTSINVNIDIFDWKSMSLLPPAIISDLIIEQLVFRRYNKFWNHPVGIMSHCSYYKKACWKDFRNLLNILKGCEWCIYD